MRKAPGRPSPADRLKAIAEKLEPAQPFANGRHAPVPSTGQPLDPGVMLAELMATEYPEPEYIVAGLLPVGLSLLAGRPKSGKSWLALQIALAVSMGRAVLGDIVTRQVPVLYLALEDTRRRLKKRCTQLLDGLGWMADGNLDLRVQWSRSGAGGLADLTEWFDRHPGGLAIVDTLAKFRDLPRGRGSSYLEDYEAVGSLKSVADQFKGAVLLATHTRKGQANDPFDEVSGTLGVNGAADSLLVLERIRGDAAGTVYLTGRDLAEETLTLDLAPTGIWRLTCRADGIERLERPQVPRAADRCAAWLVEFLGEYAWPDDEVEQAASDAGFSKSQLRKAKAQQRAGTPRLCCKLRGFGGAWWNWLGEQDQSPPDRPSQYASGKTGKTGKTEETPSNSRSGDPDRNGHASPGASKTTVFSQSRQSCQSGLAGSSVTCPACQATIGEGADPAEIGAMCDKAPCPYHKGRR